MTRLRKRTVVALVVPFALAAAAMQWVAPKIADSMARSLRKIAASRARGGEDAALVEGGATGAGADEDAGAALQEGDAPFSPGGRGPNLGKRSRIDGGVGRSLAIRIPRDVVTRALARGLKGVHASNAVDGEGSPFGVRLAGVSALGAGLLDGDVVTSIDGTSTPDIDAATAAATHAMGRGARSVRATLLRSGEVVEVTVDMPDIDAGPS